MTKPLQTRNPPHPNPLPEGEGTRARAVIVALLLLLGVQLWLIVMPDLGIRHGHPTLIAIAALYWLCDELSLPKGWTTMLVCVGVAEVLIQRARFWRTGVEAALWIAAIRALARRRRRVR